MQLGRVVGTVVATRKEPELEGLRFLVVDEVDIDLELTGRRVVAADAVGAGVDELVLFACGSSARQTKFTHERPVDATIMAIVDVMEVAGDEVYNKGRDD